MIQIQSTNNEYFRQTPQKQRSENPWHERKRNAQLRSTVDHRKRTMEINQDGGSWEQQNWKDNSLASL